MFQTAEGIYLNDRLYRSWNMITNTKFPFLMLALLVEYIFLTILFSLYFNQLHITLYNFFKISYMFRCPYEAPKIAKSA